MKHGSLFSGIGGFDLAAEWMGWENVFYCEINKFCLTRLKHYWPNAKAEQDIQTTDFRIYRGGIDVLSAGFPCQDISIVSRTSKGINGEKSGLWRELVRAISEMQPRFVVVENSTAILSRGFEQLLFEVFKIGYDAEWHCLQGNQFGTPQRRKRLFLILYPIGHRDRLQESQVFTGWYKFKHSAWRNTEDRIYRMANDVPNRVDRHGALGKRNHSESRLCNI